MFVNTTKVLFHFQNNAYWILINPKLFCKRFCAAICRIKTGIRLGTQFNRILFIYVMIISTTATLSHFFAITLAVGDFWKQQQQRRMILRISTIRRLTTHDCERLTVTSYDLYRKQLRRLTAGTTNKPNVFFFNYSEIIKITKRPVLLKTAIPGPVNMSVDQTPVDGNNIFAC